jgi:hypothetical protein
VTCTNEHDYSSHAAALPKVLEGRDIHTLEYSVRQGKAKRRLLPFDRGKDSSGSAFVKRPK